jgi:hydrogenase nickel incorporation protein HypA/HybF
MHEFALAQNIIAAIEKNIGEDFSKLTAVHIEVGEFAGIVTDSLAFGLEVALKDRDLEDVQIDIKNVPALAICECGNQYNIKDIFETCPQCQSLKREIKSGTDVIISSVEVSD